MKHVFNLFKILTVICYLSAAGAVTAKECYIYRNDSDFQCFRLDDNFAIRHITDNGQKIRITHSDYNQNPVTTVIPLGCIDSIVVRDAAIPALHFFFPDNQDLTWVEDKENYISATLDIEGNGVVEDASGLSLSVKGRGNTTWMFNKKPMRLKFAKKTSICGFKKAKSYVLLADYIDPSKMRNVVGLWLARELGMPYANHTQHCRVYVNGQYAGLYLLTEKIGINSGSVDIDENQGILFEESQEMDEKYQFKSALYDRPMMVKDPDFDDLYEKDPAGLSPEERLTAWQSDYNKAEELVYDGKGFDAFDLTSTVNYLLVMNVVGNGEIGFPKSVYLYKENANEKYKYGPVWDLDVTCNFAYGYGKGSTLGEPVITLPTYNIWVSGVLNRLRSNYLFKNAYRDKFKEFYENIFPKMLKFIDNYGAMIEPDAKMDAMKYPEEYIESWYYRMPGSDHRNQVQQLKQWLTDRVEYLKTKAEQGNL